MGDVIRLLLSDDQRLFSEGLMSILERRADDITVVGIAHDGVEAVRLTEELKPHVILMDVRMPGMDGVEATRRIHALCPSVQIMMLTTFDDDAYVHEALRYGAAGYVLKDIAPEELIADIRALHKGSVLVSETIAAKIIGPAERPSREGPAPAWYGGLNDRERRILELMARGYDNKRISETVFLAEQTVRNYISAIYEKMGVHDRVQAIVEIQKYRIFDL